MKIERGGQVAIVAKCHLLGGSGGMLPQKFLFSEMLSGVS